MTARRIFIAAIFALGCVSLSVLVALFVLFTTTWPPEESPVDRPFAQIGIPELEKLLMATSAHTLNGKDQLITAKGSFRVSEFEEIRRVFLKNNFTIVDEIDFVAGSGENWDNLDGKCLQRLFFERAVPQWDQVKLFDCGEKGGAFQFQSTSF